MLEKLFRRRHQGTKGAMMALSHTLSKNKMIGAMHIDMLETQRSKPLHILWPNLLPVVAQFVQRILYVPGVPQNDHVDHKPQRAQLILLTLAIALTKLTALAMKDMPGDTVPSLTAI